MNVDHFLLIKVQHTDHETTAYIALSSLASDHVRLFRPGKEAVTSILALNKSTDWDTTIYALGSTINSHKIKISSSCVEVNEMKPSP